MALFINPYRDHLDDITLRNELVLNETLNEAYIQYLVRLIDNFLFCEEKVFFYESDSTSMFIARFESLKDYKAKNQFNLQNEH